MTATPIGAMRFYFRTSESTGVSVGPLGLAFILPIYAMVAALWAAALLAYLLFKVVVHVVQVARATRS